MAQFFDHLHSIANNRKLQQNVMQWNSIGNAAEVAWRYLKQVFMPKIKSLLFSIFDIKKNK